MVINSNFDAVKKASLSVLLLTQSLFVYAQQSEAPANEPGDPQAAGAERQQAFSFPGWPDRGNMKQERIPPPPPGPYMSSALSGSSVEGLSFAREHRAARRPEPPRVRKPMEKFSPDISWPSSNNSRSPDRWKPETGYSYVKPDVTNQPSPVMPANNYYGYRYPAQNWPGSGSNMMPSMGMSSGRAYPVQPVYQNNRAP